MASQFEFDWLSRLVRKKRTNLQILNIVLGSIWVIGIAVCVTVIQFEDGKFSQCEDSRYVAIEDLTPDIVEEYPYIQIGNACPDDIVVYFTKDSKTTYYYLLRSCDSSSENKVIVVADEEFERMVEKNDDDTLLATAKFLTGKMEKGFSEDVKLMDYIRNSWHINTKNSTYLLYADYTPEDERQGDLLAVGITLLVTMGVFILALTQRKANIRELRAWEKRLAETYPEGYFIP